MRVAEVAAEVAAVAAEAAAERMYVIREQALRAGLPPPLDERMQVVFGSAKEEEEVKEEVEEAATVCG